MGWFRRHKQQQERGLEVKSLDMVVESLPPVAGTGFLNLHWILQAVDVVIASHEEVQQLLISPNGFLLAKDRNFMAMFTEVNTKLLEVCNMIKRSMSAASQCRMHVKYVLNLMKSSAFSSAECQESQLAKMRSSLEDCIAQLDGHKRTGGWLLLEDFVIGQRLKSCNAKTKIASKVTEANLVSFLVLSALLAAFPCKEEAGTGPGIHPNAAISQEQIFCCAEFSAARKLHEGLREEAEAMVDEKNRGSILLGAISESLKQVMGLLDSWLCRKQFPVGKDEEQKLKMLLHTTEKKVDYFESGFGILEEQMADLFAKLVANRKQVLARSIL